MDETAELLLSVSDFVALTNQTLEFAFPTVVIEGELANFKISKNRWVYFDLKDADASVRFFGTVYNLPGPLQEGMLLKVRGQPRLHQQFGFSVTVQTIQPSGEGSIKKAAELLQQKLTAEGLFDPSRKRYIPYPPEDIILIASEQSAAYADFKKIMNARWPSLTISLIDVQVQGERAVADIVQAFEQANSLMPDAIVLIRGGGSADDLAAFSTEQVTRAVAASRAPTMVAIGHEVDISLAELAADVRASTPSNAAELLVPDRAHELKQLNQTRRELGSLLTQSLVAAKEVIKNARCNGYERLIAIYRQAVQQLHVESQLAHALSPTVVLKRGYAIVRTPAGAVVRTVKQAQNAGIVELTLSDGNVTTTVNNKE